MANLAHIIDTSIEQWTDIPGFEGKYQASTLGRIRSLPRPVRIKNGSTSNKRGRVLRQNLCCGYYSVSLGKGFTRRVNRLIAITFIPNPEQKPHVNHIDGNKLNNRLENLEWNTALENVQHSIRMGLKGTVKGNVRADMRHAVRQLDRNGNLIRLFECVNDAENKTGIAYQSISAVCRKRRASAGGYIWEYAKEVIHSPAKRKDHGSGSGAGAI